MDIDYCRWQALCENVAVGMVDSVNGPVPTCQRCADRNHLVFLTVSR